MKYLTHALLLLLLVACEGKGEYETQLDNIDSLLNVPPNGQNAELYTHARQMLQDIPAEAWETDPSLRAYYGLLCVKAQDKIHFRQTSDTLILPVLHYYEENEETSDKLAEAYYYAGRVYSDLGDAPQALDYFEHALDLLNSTEPPTSQYNHLRCVTLSQMGSLMIMQQLYADGGRMYREAYHYDQLAADTTGMIYDLRDIARAYFYNQQNDSALSYYQQAEQLAVASHNEKMRASVVGQQASLYIQIGQPERAIQLTREAFPHIHQAALGGAYSTLAKAFHMLNQLDSAHYYYQLTLSNGNIYAKRNASKGLAEIALAKGQTVQADSLLNLYAALADSVDHIVQTETVSRIHHLYNYNLREREIARLSAENQQKQKHTIILICIIAATLLLTFLLFHKYKKNQRFTNLQQRRFEQWEKQQYRQSEQYIHDNETKLQLLIQQLEAAEQQREEYRQQLLLQKENLEQSNQIAEQQRQLETMKRNQLLRTTASTIIRDCLKHERMLRTDDWETIISDIDRLYNDFSTRLLDLYPMNDIEQKVSLLLKMEVHPAQIAILIGRTGSAVTLVRTRLIKKTFGIDGKARDWDEFILSL